MKNHAKVRGFISNCSNFETQGNPECASVEVQSTKDNSLVHVSGGLTLYVYRNDKYISKVCYIGYLPG